MHFSKIILALLPAFVVAEEGETTTETSTAVVTKTYFLSSVHTVTATYNTESTSEVVTTSASSTHPIIPTAQHNTTITVESTPKTTIKSTASSSDVTSLVTGATTAVDSEPTAVGPDSAASALGAGNLAIFGVAGVIAAVLM